MLSEVSLEFSIICLEISKGVPEFCPLSDPLSTKGASPLWFVTESIDDIQELW